VQEVRVWTPRGAPRRAALPLLVVHDGPGYESRAKLTAWARRAIGRGALPPFRIALLAAPDRDESYSASARYARALVHEIVPALPAAGPPVGMGASLGALAMLHAEWRFPGTFAALFLQSGSFYVPRYDRHESGFARYGRIVRFVRSVRRAGSYEHTIPVTMTCGTSEENLDNNRAMAGALAARGWHAVLHEIDGAHDFATWRAALDPHLTDLLAALWRR
jgi:enterochelin esterase family protein